MFVSTGSESEEEDVPAAIPAVVTANGMYYYGCLIFVTVYCPETRPYYTFFLCMSGNTGAVVSNVKADSKPKAKPAEVKPESDSDEDSDEEDESDEADDGSDSEKGVSCCSCL